MLQLLLGEAELRNAFPHGLDPIDASQNEPVIFGEILERSVQRAKRAWLADFNKRHFQDLGTEFP